MKKEFEPAPKLKICKKCKKDKPTDEFYKHISTRDRLNQSCKNCHKEHIRNILNKKYETSLDFREKSSLYTKKKGIENSKKASLYNKKYPEKYAAHRASQHIDNQGMHKHHWSYNEQHFIDLIFLSAPEHSYTHRFIKYDEISHYYFTEEGYLLDTKEKHMNYISLILKSKK